MISQNSGTKLFHTVVILGMSIAHGACSSTTSTTGDGGSTAMADASTTNGSDSGALADAGGVVPPADAGANDAFAGWFCCG